MIAPSWMLTLLPMRMEWTSPRTIAYAASFAHYHITGDGGVIGQETVLAEDRFDSLDRFDQCHILS
jgi:hypothetical protein